MRTSNILGRVHADAVFMHTCGQVCTYLSLPWLDLTLVSSAQSINQSRGQSVGADAPTEGNDRLGRRREDVDDDPVAKDEVVEVRKRLKAAQMK